MSPSIPEERMAVLSTTHLTAQQAEMLTEAINDMKLAGMSREEGLLLYLDAVEMDIPYGLGNLNFMLGYLKALGFVWVLFDRDGETVPYFTEYAW